MTAATLLRDEEIPFSTPKGTYVPRNYDRKFHGDVRLRQALACSYNVPAVALLDRIGTGRLYRTLHAAGFSSLRRDPAFYGIGLTLGNGEVTLFELVQAYAAIARKGVFRPARTVIKLLDPLGKTVRTRKERISRRIFSRETAFLLTHILSDADARIPAFGYGSPLHLPFACAAKTGTTKDFRDNWTVGYTTKYTVGVWVGNFDAEPMHGVSGITGCGPLFRDIMLFLHRRKPPDPFPVPPSLVTAAVCPDSGLLAGGSCPGRIEEIFVPGTEPCEMCRLHGAVSSRVILRTSDERRGPPYGLGITFPADGDVFKLDPVLRRAYQTLCFRISVPDDSGIRKVEWRLNGRKIGIAAPPFHLVWNIEPGSYTIKAVAHGRGGKRECKTVRFRVLL